MLIRPRTTEDLDELAALARTVHQDDGYPPWMPDDDFRSFIDSSGSLGSWVAVVDEAIVGHVALNESSSKEVVDLACDHLSIASSQVGVVARLLVASSRRGTGTGRELLEWAEGEARERRLVPILDVVDILEPAISLYERAGWYRIGTVEVALPDGTSCTEHVYHAAS